MSVFQKAKLGDLPDDEYLSAEELLHLQHRLVERAQTLIDASRDTVNTLTADRSTDADLVDVASNEADREFSLRMAGRERHMLRKLSYALSKLGEGEYGVCEECGEAIGYKRLLARPVARMCVDCKTRAEQLESRSRVI
ncbi:MAG: TraR/DksA C4-type zinc finger protein [Alphaproteobacteria bacterium]|nr:TraR/DksA C4-type zinc finger protein [Alphaproteobacteria bacterium]